MSHLKYYWADDTATMRSAILPCSGLFGIPLVVQTVDPIKYLRR